VVTHSFALRVLRSADYAYVKDGINDYVVVGRQDAVNPNQTETKAAAHYRIDIGATATSVFRLRLTAIETQSPFGAGFDGIVAARLGEADAFCRTITPANAGEDAANVMRQAIFVAPIPSLRCRRDRK
jgi:hypothetical protein